MWRRTGAIFWLTRPATIIRSAWRGEARKTSAPKRARSNFDAETAIISMAQQASPNAIGQMELARAQLTTQSTFVRRTFSFRSGSGRVAAPGVTIAWAMAVLGHDRPGAVRATIHKTQQKKTPRTVNAWYFAWFRDTDRVPPRPRRRKVPGTLQRQGRGGLQDALHVPQE